MGCKGETLGARLNSDPEKGRHGLGKNNNYLPRQPMSSEYLCTYLVSTCIAALNTCDGGNLTSQREINSQSGILHINEITIWVSCGYCWFVRDVKATMLVVKNKSISLFWELNSIFRQILREKIISYWPPTWPPCCMVANQELALMPLFKGGQCYIYMYPVDESHSIT